MEGYLASILSSIPQNEAIAEETITTDITNAEKVISTDVSDAVNWVKKNWLIVTGVVIAGALVGYFIARK